MARRFLGHTLGLALFTTTAIASAEVPISEEARRHFSLGVSFIQDPDGARYEEAYQEFKTAYAASPSWKILGNLGIAAFKLERDGEAIEAFEKYLAEGADQIDAEERAQFERDLQTLQSVVVRLKLQSAPPGASIIDERIPASGPPILNRYGALGQATELGLHPGHHRITAKLAGHADAVVELDLVPGQTYERILELKPEAPPVAVASSPPVERGGSGNGLRVASYAALGVGVVGLGVGTVFGLKAKSEYDQGNDLCPSFPCQLTSQQASAREAHGEDGNSAKALSLVGFIVGGAGLATGATLFLLSGKKAEPSASQASVRPWVGVGSMGLSGSFQ
jgi:tetratricopeptide (TPR) repeat protein